VGEGWEGEEEGRGRRGRRREETYMEVPRLWAAEGGDG